MKNHFAIKAIENHINGDKNNIATIILSDIYKSAIKNGAKPPFIIKKIAQLEEEIEQVVDEEMQEISEENQEEPSDPSEDHPSENDLYFSKAGPATYDLVTEDLNLTASNTVFTDIMLDLRNEQQMEILQANVSSDRVTVYGEASLISGESNTLGIELPTSYDGIVIFEPISPLTNTKTTDKIIGYYSI